MQTILDAPVVTPQAEEATSIGLVARQTGDGVLHFGGRLAFALARSFQTNDLLESWPAREKGHDTGAGPKRTRNDAAMLFAMRLCLAQIPVGLTLTGGGKTNE